MSFCDVILYKLVGGANNKEIMKRRRNPYDADRLDALATRVRNRYVGTPLELLGRKMGDDLAFVSVTLRDGGEAAHAAEGLAKLAEQAMEQLPQTFCERFLFDVALLQAVRGEWEESAGRRLFSGEILPRHGSSEWSYRMVSVSQDGPGRILSVRVVHFPGRDAVEEIDLTEYPFLLHEMGHDFFNMTGRGFAERFVAELGGILSRWRLRGISDRGAARTRAMQTIDRADSLWTPATNQRDWAHEVAVDVVALWTGGPAYLDAYRRTIEYRRFNPFTIVEHHPPYGARAAALVEAADRLGWGAYAAGLRGVIDGWRRDATQLGRDNAYATFADPGIVAACVRCAFATCEEWRLPRCDQARLERVAATVKKGAVPNFGADVILAAWIVARDGGEDALYRWEGEAIPALLGSVQAVTPDTL